MENIMKIDKLKKLLNRKSIIIIIIFGTILFITAFFVANYSMTYKKTLVKNENFDIAKTREMSAMVYFNPSKEDIFKYLKEGKFDWSYNIYLIELNKKYSILTSPLFFTIFILAFFSKLKKYPKIGFAIIIFSCFLYWVLLFSCQTISIRRYLGKFGFLIMWLPNIITLPITFLIYIIKNRLLSLWTKAKGFNGT
jgi:lipopolysaccharide export LptBFGC system permease protein LptF